MRKNFSLITLMFLALCFFTGCPGSGSGNNSKASSNNSNISVNTSRSQTPAATASNSDADSELKPDSHLNLANYAKLVTGIKYNDAVKILGASGTLIGENDIPGTKTAMYQWNNASGAFIKIVFQNDKLIDKVQTGLR